MNDPILNKDQLKENIKASNKWLRGLAMVIFAFVVYFALFVVYGLMIIQFLFHLVTNETNQRLLSFSQSLNTYIHQICTFLLYKTEQKPYPFNEWPTE